MQKSDVLHDGVIPHEQSADHSIDQERFRLILHWGFSSLTNIEGYTEGLWHGPRTGK